MGNHRLCVGYIWNLIQETTVNLKFSSFKWYAKIRTAIQFSDIFALFVNDGGGGSETNFRVFLPIVNNVM